MTTTLTAPATRVTPDAAVRNPRAVERLVTGQATSDGDGVKLTRVLTQPLPGYLKQNLSVERVINFIAIAWLAVWLVRNGFIAQLAQRLPGIVNVGQLGLVCFVGGTVISLVVDTATPRALHGVAHGLAALAGDLVAIIAMLMLARIWRDWSGRLSRRPAVRGADV